MSILFVFLFLHRPLCLRENIGNVMQLLSKPNIENGAKIINQKQLAA